MWNRQRYVKDPSTGKRVSRINPQDAWIVTEVPELRIVDDALWQAAKARQEALSITHATAIAAVRASHTARAANPLNATHRPRSLLSGLLECGCCGGPYALRGQDRFGCSTHLMNGSCASARSIARTELEERVLAGLRHRLMAPEVVAEAMRAYAEETNRLNRERLATTEAARQDLVKVSRAIQEIVGQIESGTGNRTLIARLTELEAREDELNARLSAAPAELPALHPNIADIYARKVARLAEALNQPDERRGAAEAIRGLIEKIVLTPGAKRGELTATLHGELGTILEWTAQKGLALKGPANKAPAQKRNTPGAGLAGVSASVVAGARFELTTFRL